MRHSMASSALLVAACLCATSAHAGKDNDTKILIDQMKAAVPSDYTMLMTAWSPHYVALLTHQPDPAGWILSRDPKNSGDEFQRHRYEAERRPILEDEIGQFRRRGTEKICFQQDGIRMPAYDFGLKGFRLSYPEVATVGDATFRLAVTQTVLRIEPNDAEALTHKVEDRRYSVALDRAVSNGSRNVYMVFCGKVSGKTDADGNFLFQPTSSQAILPKW